MRSGVISAVAFAATILVSGAGEAMPLATPAVLTGQTVAVQPAVQVGPTPKVELVRDGCGIGFHRDFYGFCRPNFYGYGFYRPYGFGYGFHRFGYGYRRFGYGGFGYRHFGYGVRGGRYGYRFHGGGFRGGRFGGGFHGGGFHGGGFHGGGFHGGGRGRR